MDVSVENTNQVQVELQGSTLTLVGLLDQAYLNK